MSYNGSGTFQINSSGQPVVTGTVISSTAFNALTADLATGLSTAITKDGQTTTTARIAFAQGVSSTLVTDATSATTGSIITAGGISTQKALWVGTTSRLVGNVQADALVSIGTTPQTGVPLYIQAPGAYVNLNSTTNGYSTVTGFDSGTQRWSIGQNGGNYGNGISFFYGTTEGMRLDSSGNLLVGTTSAPVHNGFVRASGGFQCADDQGTGYFAIGSFGSYLARSSTGGATTLYSAQSSINVIAQTNGVYLGSNASSWAALSDIRFKDVIEPIANATQKLAKLRAIIGKYKTDPEETRRSMLIAQDFLGNFEEALDMTDLDKFCLRTADVIPLLVAAIQELTTRLAALEAK